MTDSCNNCNVIPWDYSIFHVYCPECFKKHYIDVIAKLKQERNNIIHSYETFGELYAQNLELLIEGLIKAKVIFRFGGSSDDEIARLSNENLSNMSMKENQIENITNRLKDRDLELAKAEADLYEVAKALKSSNVDGGSQGATELTAVLAKKGLIDKELFYILRIDIYPHRFKMLDNNKNNYRPGDHE